jgi:hypothetical protein
MVAQKNVMIIGLEPTLIDFPDSFFANSPGLNASKILDGLNAAAENLRREGYTVQICLTDSGRRLIFSICSHRKTQARQFLISEKSGSRNPWPERPLVG